MAQENMNTVADLAIRLGVVTDTQGLAEFIKTTQKGIAKATYVDGKKKKGFSNNYKDLEQGAERYKQLLQEVLKKAQALSEVDVSGGIKKGADGKITALGKAYNGLAKELRKVEQAMNRLNPEAIRIDNEFRKQQLEASRIREREIKEFNPEARLKFSDFMKDVKKEKNLGLGSDNYFSLASRFNEIEFDKLTKKQQWEYNKIKSRFADYNTIQDTPFLGGVFKERDSILSMKDNDFKNIEDKIGRLKQLRDLVSSMGNYAGDKMSTFSNVSSLLGQELGGLYEKRKNIISPEQQSKEDIARNRRRKASEERITREKQRQVEIARRMSLELDAQTRKTSIFKGKLGQVGSMLRQYFNLWAIKSFAENIVKITAEFDRQRRALGALINDQSKSITIFQEIKNMALESPFTTLELTKTAKGLSAYSIETKNLVRDTKMLGDVASATGVDIQRLVLAYGQVKTATWLRGQEVRQFTEAGVPILDALAKRYSARDGRNVSTKEVQEMISNRQVSFKDVEESLRAMTEEGGKFYNMQEVLADTTYGKILKISDAWQQGWEKVGRGNRGFINGFLDTIIAIVKNIKQLIPHFITIGGLLFAANQYKKIALAQEKRELSLITERERLEEKRALANTAAKNAAPHSRERMLANRSAAYYRGQIQNIDAQIKQARAYNMAMGRLNSEMNRTNNVLTKIGITGKKTWLTITAGIKSATRAIGAFLKSNWVFILITIGVEIYNIFSNANAKAKELQANISDISIESDKKTKELTNGFLKYAKAAVSAADGSKKQEEALQALAQTYGDILPAEMLSIENLRRMNGEYKELINQIKNYQEIQKRAEIRSGIINSEKFKDAVEEPISGATHIIKRRNLDNSLIRNDVDKDIIERMNSQISALIKTGYVKNIEDFQKEVKKMAEEERLIGFKFTIDKDAIELFKTLDKYSDENARIKQYGGQGNSLLKYVEKAKEIFEEEVGNIKTGNDLITKRDSILETYAEKTEKYLNNEISKQEMIDYIMGKKTAAVILEGKNIKKNTAHYNQMLQTMTAMRNEFSGLWDGVDIFSERSQNVLNIWKDAYITFANIKEILGAGSTYDVKTYENLLNKKNSSQKSLETILKQTKLQTDYQVDKGSLQKVLNVKDKKSAQEARKLWYSKNSPDRLGDPTNIKGLNEMVDTYLDYYLEGFVDEEKKKSGGSGESALAKWKRTLNDWIGVLDKARQHYKELGDLFFDETALDKTVKAYEKQFKMYEGQFMEIMKSVNISSLKEWISTEQNYIKGLEAIIAEVDKKITSARGKDLKDLQEFRFQLSQKISSEQINNIKNAVESYVKEVERQMEVVGGRINIFEKIFDKTGSTSIAESFADAFYGAGSRNVLATMRKGFSNLLTNAAAELKDEAGKEIYENIIKMFNGDSFDFSEMERAISNLDIPKEIREQLLKIFKEFKQTNEKVLEESLNFYEKSKTIDEKRVLAYTKAQKQIDDINALSIENRQTLIDNVNRGLEKQLADLELEAIKSSQIYLTLFNNIEHAGVSSLSMLRTELEKLKDAFKDDPVKIKALNDELKKIDDRLQPERYKLEDIFSLPSKKDLLESMQEIDKAIKEYRAQQKKSRELTDKIRELQNKRQEEIDKITPSKESIRDKNPGVTEEKLLQLIDAATAEQIKGSKTIQDLNRQIAEKQKEQEEHSKILVEADKKREELEMKLYNLESLRTKAIEQMIQRIEKAFQIGSDMNAFASSIVQTLKQGNTLFGRPDERGTKGSHINRDTEIVLNSLSSMQSFFNSYKSVFDNGLKMWKNLSNEIMFRRGKITQEQFAKLQNENTSEGRLQNATDNNTDATMRNTQAIINNTNVLQGKTNGGMSANKTIDVTAEIGVSREDMAKIAREEAGKGDWVAEFLSGLNMGYLGAGSEAMTTLFGYAMNGDERLAGKGLLSAGADAAMASGNPYVMAAGGVAKLATAIWDAADKIHDAHLQDQIDDLADKIEQVNDNIQRINNVIRRSTGNSVVSGRRDAIKEQQKQLEYLQQQYDLAKKKKGVSKEELKTYEKQIKDMRQAIRNAEDELFESLLGSGIDQYMKNLVKLFADAAKQGSNTFKVLKNNFGEMLSGMVEDTIMTTIIKNRLNGFFEQIEQISKRGGMGTGEIDDIIATGLQAMQDVNNDLWSMQPLINRINNAFGVNSSSAGSLTSGVKGMSEETAGMMSGYLIANFDRLGEIQKSVFRIEQVVAGNTASGMMTQYQTDAITHLAQIEANTLRSADKVSDFYDLLNNMKVVNTNGSGAVYGLQIIN